MRGVEDLPGAVAVMEKEKEALEMAKGWTNKAM